MQITLDIADDIISNTIETGLDNGIHHWARVISRSKDNLTVTLSDIYENKIYKLTPESWPLAVRFMFLGVTHDGSAFTRKHFGDMIAEHGDATTGDVLVQLACFGEIVYG